MARLFRSSAFVVVACIVGLAGCGGGTAGSAEQKPADSAAAEEGVFDPLVGALDRAKAVEDIGLERKQELDERMEALE